MQEKERLDEISRRIIGAAIEVHRHLGPGLLESAYQACLVFELKRLGLRVEEQKSLPVIYKDVKLDCGCRLDLVVEDEIIIEIKAVEELLPISRRPSPFVPAVVQQESRSFNELPCLSSEERPETNCE
jgi:GxxExxY protein